MSYRLSYSASKLKCVCRLYEAYIQSPAYVRTLYARLTPDEKFTHQIQSKHHAQCTWTGLFDGTYRLCDVIFPDRPILLITNSSARQYPNKKSSRPRLNTQFIYYSNFAGPLSSTRKGMDWLKKKTQAPSTATSTIEIATAGAPPDLSGTPVLASQTVGKGDTVSNSTPETESSRETPSAQGARETSVEALDSEKEETSGDAGLTRQMSSISNDDNVVYPSGIRLIIITVSLCFAVFLVALDQTIIATAMYYLTAWIS